MACLDANQVLDLLQQRLDDAAAAAARTHLSTCGTCRRLVAALANDSLCGVTPSASVAPTLPTDRELAAPNRAAPSLSPGVEIDHYRILRLLGRGSMGVVYLAHDQALDRRVALKFISAETLVGRARERFLFEARATARVSHPHIVTIYAVGEFQQCPYIALEFLDGETLRDRLRRVGRLERDEALRVALAIARAVQHAHRHGVLHRDLKPDNVMITRDEIVRVVDFGLAQSLDRAERDALAAEATRTERSAASQSFASVGGLRGTPLYIAPEQWCGAPATPATDVWAFGVTLCELLSGAVPFARRAADDDTGPPLGRWQAALPAGLAPAIVKLVAACLARDAAQRPTMAVVAQTLAALTRRAPRVRRRLLWAAALPTSGLVLALGLAWVARTDTPAAAQIPTVEAPIAHYARHAPQQAPRPPAAAGRAAEQKPHRHATGRRAAASASKRRPTNQDRDQAKPEPRRRFVGEGLMDY